MVRRLFIPVLLLALIATSCKYKLSDRPNWDTDLLTPLVKSRVTLADALQDTNMVRTNADNSVSLVFRDTIADLRLSDYLAVPDTSLEAKVTLDSISLATDSLIRDITLGEIARQLEAQGNSIGTTLLNSHGQTLFYLPAFSGINSGDVDIDASQFFEEAELQSGTLLIRIENHLPVDIDYVTFHLRNNGNYTDTLIRKTLGPIPTGATVTDNSDLSGKTVESQMAGQMEDIATQDGTNVPIDTNDYIRLKIIVKDMKASRATAVFPAQTVINSINNAKYNFGPDVSITRMSVKEGTLKIRAISTINDTLEFIYSLPTAIKDGQLVRVVTLLNPAPVGGQVVNEQDFDLAGYFIDLTMDGDSVNIFPQRLIANLKYSGNLVTMDLADSITVFYGLESIIPDYIEGYFGAETFSFADQIDLDFFNSVLGGSLDLENPRVDLTFFNSLGMDGELVINQMTAVNNRTGGNVALTGSAVNGPVFIPGPKLPNVGQGISTQLKLDGANSNIRDFVSLLPDQIQFDMDVLVNQNANPFLKDNFATDESRISAFLNIEMPLHGMADELTLVDTMDLNVDESTIPAEVNEGTLRLIVENTFPIEAKVQMYFDDASGSVLDSLFSDGMALIPAATVDGNGFVISPGKGEPQAVFPYEKLQLLKAAKFARVKFSVTTKPNGQPIKIYSDYGIDFKLVGNFNYHIGS